MLIWVVIAVSLGGAFVLGVCAGWIARSVLPDDLDPDEDCSGRSAWFT